MTLYVSATIELSPNVSLEKAKAELSALIIETVKEEGCIKFDIHPHLENDKRFILWEIWTSEKALQDHYDAVHTQKYFKQDLTQIVEVQKLQGPL